MLMNYYRHIDREEVQFDFSAVADLMQTMDVFVFPSLYEGLPVTMVEAQAAGLPCVISDKVPPECILTDGLVDILPLSAEPETWAAKILEKKNLPRTDRAKRCNYDCWLIWNGKLLHSIPGNCTANDNQTAFAS